MDDEYRSMRVFTLQCIAIEVQGRIHHSCCCCSAFAVAVYRATVVYPIYGPYSTCASILSVTYESRSGPVAFGPRSRRQCFPAESFDDLLSHRRSTPLNFDTGMHCAAHNSTSGPRLHLHESCPVSRSRRHSPRCRFLTLIDLLPPLISISVPLHARKRLCAGHHVLSVSLRNYLVYSLGARDVTTSAASPSRIFGTAQ